MRLVVRIGLLGVVLGATACGGGSAEPPAGPPQASKLPGRIAFTRNRSGWGEIWSMAATGGGLRRLTDPPPQGTDATGNRMASWSPDGKRIAYVGSVDVQRESDRTQEIFVMNADGSGKRRLTSNNVADFYPAWSPDGRRIVFARLVDAGAGGQEAAIVVTDADGKGERVVARETSATDPVFLSTPAWSPDGEQIAFTRAVFTESALESAIYLVSPTGGTPRRLEDDAAAPAWSPDGEQIAFTSQRDHFGQTCFQECSVSQELYVMSADGEDAERLTETQADDSAPAWSPDGRWLVFVSDRADTDRHAYQLYAIAREGGDATRLTRDRDWTLEPDWGSAA